MAGPGFIFLMTGPSGAGKSTLLERVMRADPRLGFSVSCTTRPPRRGEVDGRDYYFVDRDTFERRVASGDFVEYAEVHANLYGTLIEEIDRLEAEGRIPVLDIDVQGGVEVIERFGERVVSVFVFPPDFETLEARLRGRGTDDEATIQRRLTNARTEVGSAPKYRYWVVNDDADRAANDLLAILRAEELRRERWPKPPVEPA